MTKKEELTSPLVHHKPAQTAASLAAVLVVAEQDKLPILSADQFAQAGCNAHFADTIDAAHELLNQLHPPIVFMSLNLDNSSTLGFLKRCQTLDPKPTVVVIASNEQINDAADAMRIGADDCLFYPFGSERLDNAIREALQSAPPVGALETPPQDTVINHLSPGPQPVLTPVAVAPASNDGARPKNAPPPPQIRPLPRPAAPVIIGAHPKIRTVLRDLDGLAKSNAPVLIQGEFGTGKEIFARSIHHRSGRDPERFIVVDCAALSPETVAAEVFGHVASAFDKPANEKIGLAQAADGGTLYLDEIAHLTPKTQSHLLRILRSGMVQPIGTKQARHLDMRIVSATSHDLTSLLENETLQKDLYYQLNVAQISLPPLRERGEDIVLLAQQFLRDYAKSEGSGFTHLSTRALALLQCHDWPGNVHELKNAIWNSVLLHEGTELTAAMLPQALKTRTGARAQTPVDAAAPAPATETKAETTALIGRSLAEIEQIVIEETIRTYGGSVPKAARVLGVSPSTIYRKREAWQSKG